MPLTKPALGMSADYFLPPAPNTSQPDPEAKAAESVKHSNAGVDSGEIVIRGGSHLDFSWIPNPAFGASLRGADEIAWYTTAWFDKYVKGGNMFSRYYRSRLDIGLAGGGRFDCEEIRPDAMRPAPPSTYPDARCRGFVPAASDGWPGSYDYVAIDTTPDG